MNSKESGNSLSEFRVMYRLIKCTSLCAFSIFNWTHSAAHLTVNNHNSYKETLKKFFILLDLRITRKSLVNVSYLILISFKSF